MGKLEDLVGMLYPEDYTCCYCGKPILNHEAYVFIEAAVFEIGKFAHTRCHDTHNFNVPLQEVTIIDI